MNNENAPEYDYALSLTNSPEFRDALSNSIFGLVMEHGCDLYSADYDEMNEIAEAMVSEAIEALY